MKHILVCSCGTTPHVLTETLWALSNQSNITCTEVYLITTSTCQHFLTSREFLSEWETLKAVSSPHTIPPLQSSHIIVVPDNQDITHFGDYVLALLHRLTQADDTAVHVSVAGGRKEMSVLLAYGVSFFGRPQDKLYHVVATDEFIASGRYFPAEPNSTSVILWEIPYVRLRSRLSDLVLKTEVPSYKELVHTTQREVDIQRPPNITLNLNRKLLCVEENPVPLSFLECAFYLWAVRHNHAQQPIAWGKQMSDEDWYNFLDCYRYVLRLHYRRRNPPYGPDTSVEERCALLQKLVSTIKKKLLDELPKQLAAYASIRPDGCYGRKQLVVPSQVTVIPSQ